MSEMTALAAGLSREQIVHLLEGRGHDACRALFDAADGVRRRTVGDEVFLRGIVEFSSYCRNNCSYCGLRRDNRGLARYRLEPGEILALARDIRAAGCGTIVLQSGEDPGYGLDRLCRLIAEIRDAGLVVTLSLGELLVEESARLRDAGADRFLLRHEACNETLYAGLHSGRTFATRRDCLATLKEQGFEVGAGFMVGLPGQTVDDLAEDLLFLREIDADMIGIGPFLPHPRTPLACCPPGDAELVQRCVAVARLLCPEANIPATTALGVQRPAARHRAFSAGANVLMPCFTPPSCAEDYAIYPGKGRGADAVLENLASWRRWFGENGRPAVAGSGFRRRNGGKSCS